MLTSYNELQMLVWQELMGIIAPNALTMVGDIISNTVWPYARHTLNSCSKPRPFPV